ncbi:MAG: UDP-3-O-(3-hydroxymyristoyl)glucosamine N-acyltransferase [Planctomycetes bacterium]|nr:UDP-3-O-(3-hydroxymyristoyl)glucosamine N-acyltransferase [Planctomycetota bacterium]
MDVTVRQLAEWVRGEVLGDPDLAISNARTLADAGPGDVTFVETDKYLSAWHASKASAAVVGPSVPPNGRPLIRVADPLMAFAEIVRHLRGRTEEPHGVIDPTAVVHPAARLAAGVSVGPHAIIGEGTTLGENTTVHAGVVVGRSCAIGRDCVLHPRVVLYDDCVIGARVTIHAGAVLGADGFGYRQHNGRHIKIPQQGWVEIGDDVEIGACATVDRGTFGPTRVGAGTKIDNLVMIGHNCQIGRHNVLCGQVGIAGSCVTGDYVVMAGQVGVADHLKIGSRVIVGAQAGVCNDLTDDQTVFGYPAIPVSEQRRLLANIKRLPEVRADVKKIQKHLGLTEE